MIRLSAPHFWYRHGTTTAALLKPFAYAWQAVTRNRIASASPYRPRAKVICIGNVAVGGAGKTPLAIGLADALREAGLCITPCFLTRGFGGTAKGPAVIDPNSSVTHSGDEALLLARHAPTIVSRDRVAGLKLADTNGHDVVICDDGFQNPSFAKDASLLVFDGTTGIGNGFCLPAGPNRETLEDALPRATAALIVGDDKTGLRAKLYAIPVFAAHFKAAYNLNGGKYLAFAGIGRPTKFFETLAANNYDVVKAVPFPDHHAFSANELEKLATEAAALGATLITTEKDHVRLPDNFKSKVVALPVSLKVDGLPELLTLLRTRLS
ncbi:MAG: tetraacyldisaccharide 4'-kinase [Alphaproteobacteria bacterium]|nr:tetraacyldisaccharide 4'-kinase [Alphaproteobacteria bacterium]